MFRVTSSTNPVAHCGSWIQLWLQHWNHESQVDLLTLECPLLPLVFELKTSQDRYHLRREAAGPREVICLDCVSDPAHSSLLQQLPVQFPVVLFISYSTLQIKHGIYSHSEVLLSVAWPPQVYQWLWKDFFLLYFLKSSPAPLLSPSLS